MQEKTSVEVCVSKATFLTTPAAKDSPRAPSIEARDLQICLRPNNKALGTPKARQLGCLPRVLLPKPPQPPKRPKPPQTALAVWLAPVLGTRLHELAFQGGEGFSYLENPRNSSSQPS